MKRLKEILKKLLEEEDNVSSIEVTGDSLESALEKACEQLGVSIAEIDYEIKEFGTKGLFGVGKKDFKIQVYKSKAKTEILQNILTPEIEGGGPEVEVEKIIDRDSEAFLRVTSRGVLLKVTPAVGKGRKISEAEVFNIIATRGVTNFDRDLVKKVIKNSAGEYVKIGEMPLNVVNDATASVQISSDEMKAYLIMTPPKLGGFDLEMDEIRNILKSNGVVVGIKEDVLNRIIDYPIYNDPILIAEGIKPKNGKDAEIHYNFNVNKDEIHFTEEDGRVDFKNLNIVQNVVAGQVLAIKEKATIGEPGRTVTNKIIPQKVGKDCQLLAGRNCHVTEDGLQVIADKNGQVTLTANKINVEEVLTINGDVNLKTGNIIFLGTVIIQGNVEDGFSVKAAGNIEIHGSVGKCELDAEGDIIISQGVQGKNEGFIRTGKCLYAKFLQDVKVDAADSVYVQDSIMHSFIDATKEVTIVGKRAKIVGGRIRAGELVKTKEIGSVSGAETIIEVGIDPKKKQRLVELEEERTKAYKDLEPITTNLNGLEDMKKRLKNLPPEKEEIYVKLINESKRLNNLIQQLQEEIDEINNYLSGLKTKGKVIASKLVQPGVKIYIKNSFLNVKTEYKKVVFVLQGTEINVVPYTEDDKERER
ncbi:MAG TPA: FapA family protein [Spirochaetota bacterium]|nr:FapA family protein [Spirochaetota bacterium]HOL56865.1 FapA family protein [Spirochaetota bacterium]HPP03355.1 FapA family protein [Spirochaetota bacterium]